MPLFFPPRTQYEDVNGAVLVGAKLWFYVTGTSTPKNTYTTSALSSANTNPVVADANGIFPDIYLATDTDYKVILTTSAGVAGSPAIWTVDPYFSNLGTGRTPVADANYAATINDRLIAYTTLTATRTVSLPAALLFPAGTRLVIVDESGNGSPSKLINVAPNGTDTINGSNTTQLAINSAYGRASVESNGISGWFWLDRDGWPVKGTFRGGETARPSTTTLSVTAGVRADSTNVIEMSFAAGTINAAIVGANGLDASSLVAATSYHSFAIMKTDGTTAFLLSTSPTAPTMPSGYVYKKRLASHKTAAGAATLIDFSQVGDDFYWVAAIIAESGAAGTITLVGVPTGVVMSALLLMSGTAAGTTGTVTVSTPGLPTTAAQLGIAVGGIADALTSIKTNTSAQIVTTFGGGTNTFTLNSVGWNDRRGRDD